jgi:ribosomal protein S18 acetylase RimI-like enzyme
MIVRRATVADADELARVHCVSFQAAYGRPRDAARTREIWREAFVQPQPRVFAAVEEDTIVGVLSVGPARDESGDGEVYVIYVHPDWWGTQAGQLLIDRAHAVLADEFDDAVLTVLADNPRARRFYERNGWLFDELRAEPHFGGEPTAVARYRRHFKE